MATETATPAATAPDPAAAKPATPPADTKPATGTKVEGVSGGEKKPDATPEAKKPESSEPTTLLGKKLPPPEPGKEGAEAPKEGAKPKAEVVADILAAIRERRA